MRNVSDALTILKRHPALVKVDEPQEVQSGVQAIQVIVRVPLPSRQQHEGVSTTGVKAEEPSWLIFHDWPSSAPRITLREDFPLNLPHINPHRPGSRVRPCLFDGDPSELLHRFGLGRIVDQLVEWLTKAASGQLIDLTQGWEPTRRDDCPGSLIFEADAADVNTPKDGTLLHVAGMYFSNGNDHLAFLTDFEKKEVSFSQQTIRPKNVVVTGKAQVILARGVDENHKPRTISAYEPETVHDIDSLLARANRLGIDSEALNSALCSYFFRSVTTVKSDPTDWGQGVLAFVVLLVQRPAQVIWTYGRNVEMLPYIVRMQVKPERDPIKPREVIVEPLWHAEQVSPRLLAMTSGFATDILERKLVFVGCGSLGSKLGMHLGRAGFGNAATFVDNQTMGPHNVARHALIPNRNPTAYPQKAEMMCSAFNSMGYHNAIEYMVDATILFDVPATFEKIIGKGPALIVDSTASFKVEASAARCISLHEHPQVRLVQTGMYAKGRAAVLYLEGTGRSCTAEDLKTALFERCRHDPDLRAAVGGDSTDPVRIFVGDNCRSVTMPMSDSVVSRSAALVAHQLEKWLAEGLPDAGTLCFGKVDGVGISMDWNCIQLEATRVVQVQ